MMDCVVLDSAMELINYLISAVVEVVISGNGNLQK